MLRLMETPKSCPKCRHFFDGHCRLNPPPYVAVSEADWCGRFALVGVARGTPSKITDDMVMRIVFDNWTPLERDDGKGFLPPVATRRADLMDDLMEHGVSQTPVLKRIARLVASGQLVQGDDPDGKRSGIFVWPAPKDDTKETPRAGRPVAIGADALAGMIAELAPNREAAVSLRAVHRALGDSISLGALHGAVKDLVAAGRVVQDEAGVYAAAMEV